MHTHQARGECRDGLLYVDPVATDLHTALNTTQKPLSSRVPGNFVRAPRRWSPSMPPCGSGNMARRGLHIITAKGLIMNERTVFHPCPRSMS